MNKYKLDQANKPLFDELIKYGLNQSVIPFDVPGHKMGEGINSEFINAVGENIFKIDVNSLKQLDLLSNPTGVIKSAEELAADCFGADSAFFLVNGSTGGIQNMVLSVCKSGEKIILPRNVHKSTINALILSGAIPVYVRPYTDKVHGISMGVPFEDWKEAIDNNLDAKAVFILSPTYFGVTANLKKIIDYAHSKNMAVLVDESHGSHFGFSRDLPLNSMRQGADMSTISMHKTGGSLTQSSILLHNNGLIRRDTVRSVVNLSQTSSASYILMASLDIARYNLVQNDKLFSKMIDLSKYANEELNKIDGISCIKKDIENGDSIFEYDITKLVINVTELGLTGFSVYDIMKEEYQIQLELGETNVVLAIVSIGDSKKSINLLLDAFNRLAKKYKKHQTIKEVNFKINIPKMLMSPREAFFANTTLKNIDDCLGEIAGDSIMIYPPGIPLVIPGEVISQVIIDDYKFFNTEGNVVLGSQENYGEIKLKVIARKKV
ncbi:aminotransferase class I/II-fold pyridoxal phosphate-dependent enzyme [Mycoplasmatota bacterium]|nr:aminotransferase class I/II-fold pyridoxal phosphate-dependent enzyme [Mycoplasmatota bacterium]